jgi:spore germination protein YaaH
MRTAVLGLHRATDPAMPSRRRAIALLALIVAIAIAAQGMALPGPVAGGSAAVASTTTTEAPGAALPARSAATEVAASDEPSGGLQPGVQYEEAMAHEHDRIAFVPGDRVTVPFRPRAGDRWSVAGKLPRALPAGLATGRAMAASAQGSRWAKPETSGADAGTLTPVAKPAPSVTPAASPSPATEATPLPVDAPTVDATAVEPATNASTVARSPEVATSPQNAGLLRQVFGFLPYWEVNDATLNYDVLSTIAYFSVGSDASGNLLKRNADGTLTTGWGGWTSQRMTSIINQAHQRKTRVVLTISVFAWTTAQADKQRAILGSATARLNLARQAAAAVRDRGADGINLDFEPIASGYADEFTAFVRTVRAELNNIAPGYQPTFDTTGFIGNYPIENATASGAADAIFIMGYDYRTSGSNPVGSISPLTGPAYDLTDTVRAYAARVSPSKLILGVPYYGRAWSTTSDALHGTNVTSTKWGASTTVVYDSVVPYANQYGRRWDSIEQAPWVAYKKQNCTSTYGCVIVWRQIYYDDKASLAAKYDMINRYALRGAGIWALGYDGTRPELNAVLAQKFLHDTTAPLVGIRNMAARQTDAGFTVSWTGQDISGIASYDLQYARDGGPWTAWLTATTKTSEVFLGEQNHGYAFRARARDGKGNVSAWNVASTWVGAPVLAVGGFGVVGSDNVNLRAAPDTSAAKVGEMNTGDMVAIVGGPRTADGYTWWQVSGVIKEWGAVSPIDVGLWIAAGPAATPWLTAAHAPNSTLIDPVIRDFSVGDTSRAFSPNGDGARDTLRISWSNAIALDTLNLDVYRTDGTLVGSIALTQRAAGAQTYAWNGAVGGTTVADGGYVLALRGTSGTATYNAPSAKPATPGQIALFGVTVDTVAPAAIAPSAVIAAARYGIHPDATRLQVAWPASTDATSGLAGYELSSSTNGGAWTAPAALAATLRSTLAWVAWGHGYAFRVRARDGAGNVSAWQSTSTLAVTAFDQTSSAVRFSTGWSPVNSVYAFGGSLRRTTTGGRTVTFTATGRQYAFVSRLGPTEGSAAIYVDGVYQGQVSMYASSVGHKRVVWAKDFGTSQSRTITIRALGTSGHPGVYVDAILVGS